jgi:hypothetical protein
MPRNGRVAQDAHDTLLWWCSEVGSGSTRAFLDACRALDLHPWQAAWALSQLAHVEFDWRARRFAAAPTVLTTIPGVPSRLLLCGARPTGLMEQLRDAADRAELNVVVAEEPSHQFGHGPATVLIDADPADAEPFADAAEIRWLPAAHQQLVALLPAVTAEAVGEREEPDARFPHAPVDPDTFQVRWDSEWDDGREGLWRYRTFTDPRAAYLRRDGSCLRLAAVEYGPFVMERTTDAEPAIRYQPANRTLVVEGLAPLPDLHARAACLCSGRMPLRQHFADDVYEDHYVNVDPDTAAQIMTSLGMEPLHL